MKYLLDTHTWIWWNAKPESLSKTVHKTIAGGDYEEILLSAISVWEFAKLLEKNQIRISCDGQVWIDKALQMACLRLVPLSPPIAWQSTRLPGKFHDDLADQIIVATARQENATILTIDHLIRGYQHVRSIW